MVSKTLRASDILPTSLLKPETFFFSRFSSLIKSALKLMRISHGISSESWSTITFRLYPKKTNRLCFRTFVFDPIWLLVFFWSWYFFKWKNENEDDTFAVKQLLKKLSQKISLSLIRELFKSLKMKNKIFNFAWLNQWSEWGLSTFWCPPSYLMLSFLFVSLAANANQKSLKSNIVNFIAVSILHIFA